MVNNTHTRMYVGIAIGATAVESNSQVETVANIQACFPASHVYISPFLASSRGSSRDKRASYTNILYYYRKHRYRPWPRRSPDIYPGTCVMGNVRPERHEE